MLEPRTASPPKTGLKSNRRLTLWYGALLIVFGVFIIRLFYLQIIRHDYYHKQALAGQLKEFNIPSERGTISAHENGQIVPLVLNEKLYTLYVDPLFIKHPEQDAAKLAAVTGGDIKEYTKLLKTPKSRYVILAKRLSEDQKNKVADLKLAGAGTQSQDYRVYPQATLAAQLLGFVNNDGAGKYGLEQALNKELFGTPGKLKAITDAAGVPLAASKDNVQIDPKNGQNVILTIDLSMQKQLETLLKAGLDRAKSASGSALILDPNSGAVKAMANWPTYDPAQYYKVDNADVFNNAALSAPLEVGSIMKVLTASAALDQGVIKPDTSYYDPSHWLLDSHEITNIEEDGGAGQHNIADILNLSINTGATWMLMQMGGQTGKVTQQARDRWHDYMVNHFQLGKATGIEQGYEASGLIPEPDKGYALQLTYANTAFGQAMTATPLQMAAALVSVVNGGTYYQPHLVDNDLIIGAAAKAKKSYAVKQNVVSPAVAQSMRSLMEYVVAHHNFAEPFNPSYSVGGKTGTAQIAKAAGGYYDDRFNGMYIGFVGGDRPEYVIAVRVNEPHIGGYAGSGAAQPIFGDLAHMLINNFNVAPKTGS